MINRVSLERGEPHQRATLANLVQLYIHDFSELLSSHRKLEVEADGRFADLLRLEQYWNEADRAVWFIRVGGALAGFALLNTRSHCNRSVDFNMGEFFVMRAYRRGGVGARAAIDLIEMHPGQWEIAVSKRNAPALAFWPLVVAAARADRVERLEGDDKAWTGPILRFCIPAV